MEGGSVDDVFGARQRCDRPNTTIPLEYTTATNNSNVSLAPLDNQETVYSISPLTALEKLYFALDMAQAVALLHNNRYGVIVHDDIWLAQFLLSSPRHTNSTNTWLGQQRRPPRIKLNDFNRAEAMMYNYEEKRYCKYQNGKGNEDVRVECCLVGYQLLPSRYSDCTSHDTMSFCYLVVAVLFWFSTPVAFPRRIF